MPVLTVGDARAGEADGMLRFTVSLSAAAAEPVTVPYGAEDDTATAGGRAESYEETERASALGGTSAGDGQRG